jgi:hypothetical protein
VAKRDTCARSAPRPSLWSVRIVARKVSLLNSFSLPV